MDRIVTSLHQPETGTGAQELNTEAYSSGVSWGAVIAGAFAASALYLILLALGAGFELSTISPWSNIGASASTAGSIAIFWLVFIEIVASALGGYLTGRLRTKWARTHTDEVFFRDTANGFLSWALAVVSSVALLATAAASMAGNISHTNSIPEQSERIAGLADPKAHLVDVLLRSGHFGPQSDSFSSQAEAGRVLANALRTGQLPAADQAYLAKLTAARTGITLTEAERRVTEVFAQARQTEDNLRKTSARLLLWVFVSLLAGAFSASYAATIGGRQRDHIPAI